MRSVALIGGLAVLAAACNGSVSPGAGGACNDPCPTLGAARCTGMTVEVCAADERGCAGWQLQQDCAAAGQLCEDSTCVTPATCNDAQRNQDETDVDCGGVCEDCAIGLACGGDGDCASGVCESGACRLCRGGGYGCFGTWLRQCAADGSAWADAQHCNALGGEVCDAVDATCKPVAPIGNGPDSPTGTYYRFANFTPANSPFLGGADVDSYGDRIYVNRDGSHIDVYQITLLDSDGDGQPEPNQHPDNPDNPGAIEERVLTLLETYDVPIGGTHNNELYIEVRPDPASVSITFSTYPAGPGSLFEYDVTGGTMAQVASVTSGVWNQVLGRDTVNNRWYTATPYERWIFSLGAGEDEWALEFAYPNLSGDHSDGMEVVTDPRTGVPYVYISDMTSDFIAQYRKGLDGRWVQENLFRYANPDPQDVEGMGFGALDHFWVTNEGYGSGGVQMLYEIGGGDLGEYVIE